MAREMTHRKAVELALHTGIPAFWEHPEERPDAFQMRNNAGWIEILWAEPEGPQAIWGPPPADKKAEIPEDGWTHRQPCDCEFCKEGAES